MVASGWSEVCAEDSATHAGGSLDTVVVALVVLSCEFPPCVLVAVHLVVRSVSLCVCTFAVLSVGAADTAPDRVSLARQSVRIS